MKKLACMLFTFTAITVTGICADDTVSEEENPCAELPSPCNLYCQEAMSAESRALTLEQAADKTDYEAEEAKNRAEYYEDIVQQITFEVQSPNKNESRNGKSGTEPLWKVADSLLRSLVPRHARNTYRSNHRPAKSQTLRYKVEMPDGEKVDALDIMWKASKAWLEAEKTQKAALEARGAARTARTAANEARRKYEALLCR